MNNHSIVGRVGKDAEVRDAGKNKVTTFSVAWSSPFGEKNTTWFKVNLFGDRFVKLAGYIKKGDMIGVTGTTELKTYTTKDGQERTSLEIDGTNVTLMGNKRSEDTSGSASVADDDDEVPF